MEYARLSKSDSDDCSAQSGWASSTDVIGSSDPDWAKPWELPSTECVVRHGMSRC